MTIAHPYSLARRAVARVASKPSNDDPNTDDAGPPGGCHAPHGDHQPLLQVSSPPLGSPRETGREDQQRALDGLREGVAAGKSGTVLASSEPNFVADHDVPSPDDVREDDELLLAIVLKKKPFASKLSERLAVLDAVASTYIASGGVGISTRVDVTKRIAFLTTLLFERPSMVPIRHQAMIWGFHKCNCDAGYAPRLRGAFLETLLTHASSTTTQLPEPPPQQVHTGAGCRPSNDEMLMTMIMKHRPFELDGGHAEEMWNLVAGFHDVLQDKQHDDDPASLTATTSKARMMSKTDVFVVIERLTTALLKDKDPTDSALTPALRSAVIEFNLCVHCESPVYKFQAGAKRKRMRTSKKIESDRRLRAAKQQEKYELFLRIALHVQPFNPSQTPKHDAWETVFNEFVAAGGKRITCGEGARRVLKFLTTKMLHDPAQLSPEAQASLLQYYKLSSQVGIHRADDRTTLDMLQARVRPVREGDGESRSARNQSVQLANGQHIRDQGFAPVVSAADRERTHPATVRILVDGGRRQVDRSDNVPCIDELIDNDELWLSVCGEFHDCEHQSKRFQPRWSLQHEHDPTKSTESQSHESKMHASDEDRDTFGTAKLKRKANPIEPPAAATPTDRDLEPKQKRGRGATSRATARGSGHILFGQKASVLAFEKIQRDEPRPGDRFVNEGDGAAEGNK